MIKFSVRLAAAASLAAAALGVAQAAAADEPVRPGRQTGLGLTGPDVPQILEEARQAPYALPQDPNCATLIGQIAALDEVLGPDVDQSQDDGGNLGRTIMSGVRSVLPYGGIIRFITGASKKEHELVDAALAGWERRGFLKGVARNRGCGPYAKPVVAQAPAADTAATPAVGTAAAPIIAPPPPPAESLPPPLPLPPPARAVPPSDLDEPAAALPPVEGDSLR